MFKFNLILNDLIYFLRYVIEGNILINFYYFKECYGKIDFIVSNFFFKLDFFNEYVEIL